VTNLKDLAENENFIYLTEITNCVFGFSLLHVVPLINSVTVRIP
jgi:hypothetical protein